MGGLKQVKGSGKNIKNRKKCPNCKKLQCEYDSDCYEKAKKNLQEYPDNNIERLKFERLLNAKRTIKLHYKQF